MEGILTCRNSLALQHASSNNLIASPSSRGSVAWNKQRVYLASLTASKLSSTQISLTILRMVEYRAGTVSQALSTKGYLTPTLARSLRPQQDVRHGLQG